MHHDRTPGGQRPAEGEEWAVVEIVSIVVGAAVMGVLGEGARRAVVGGRFERRLATVRAPGGDGRATAG